MAGVLEIHEVTSTVTGVDKTSGTVRFKSADETSVDTANRIQIPAAGTDYSYTKQLRGYVSSAPDTDFSNLVAYTDGTGFADAQVTVEYDVTYTTGTFATNVDTDIGGTDLFTATVGSTWDIDMDSWDHTFTAGESPAYWGSNLRLQLHATSTATPGTLTAETLTFSYDET